MKINIRFKNIRAESKRGVREYLAILCEQCFSRYIGEGNLPTPMLYASLERQAQREHYKVGFRLSIGARNLVVREQSPDLIECLESAAESLEWRLRQLVSALKPRRGRSGEARRREFERAIDSHGPELRQSFARAVLPRLVALTDFVQRELAYLQAEDRLPGGDPEAAEVIDEVLLLALERTAEPLPSRLEPLLHDIAIEVIAGHVRAYRVQQLESACLDEPVGDTRMDLDLLDDSWLQDKLRLEDLVPTQDVDDPSRLVNRLETQRQALLLLRSLPSRWRRVIGLHYLDDMPIDSIAENMQMQRDEVRAAIEAGLEFLKERLNEQGVLPVDSGWPADYLVAPPPSAESRQIVDELTALMSADSGQSAA